MASLKEYYHAKRLSWQQGYFRKESHRRHRWEQFTRHIAPLCFFLSVSAACGHFVWELSHHQANRATDRPVARENDAAHPPRGPELGVVEAAPPGPKTVPTRAKHRPDNVSLGLLLAAACLPVFGAAWRTFRGANEFGRNTNRYIAMDAELSELGQKLEHAATPEDALECLWNIERAMDSAHRSWTRLMLEAEWFG